MKIIFIKQGGKPDLKMFYKRCKFYKNDFEN